METLPVAVPEDGSGANPSSVKSEDSTPPHETNRGSPPPNCPICLGTCKNKCFTDSCLHQFCFKCLLTWSKVNAVCPLCKQNFKSIIHNVRSNQQYDEYNVEQRHPEESLDGIDIDNLANLTSAATRRFRYRTTLTLPRRHSIAFQQLLLQYPMMTDVMLPPPASRAPAAPPAPPRRRDPYSFRRTVYRHNLWARPLPDFTGRFGNCTPEFYRFNETQTQRLVPWITRELPFLLSDRAHTSYVLSRLLDLLPRYHINSPEVRQEMQQYLGEHTEHFLHELYCFASTPYDLTGYDRNVQYTTDTRISSMVNEVISSSDTDASVDSDIVMVTSSGPAEAGPSRAPAHPPPHPHPHPHPPPDNVIPIETISHSDTDDDSSEVMVVGYLKPPRERTPEVVDLLGSDSDVILQDSVPPEPAPADGGEEVRPGRPLVKLTLKRHSTMRAGGAAAAAAATTDSDDSTYTPPSPRARKRRRRSRASATTSDTCRTTPSPLPPEPRSPSPTVSRFGRSDSASTATGSSGYRYQSASDTSSDTSYRSSDRRKKTAKKKSRRKVYTKLKNMTEKSKKKAKKTTPDSHHRDSKRKSHLGKGVKSSKKNDTTGASSSGAAVPPAPAPAPATPAAPAAPAPEQPSTSGAGGGRSTADDRPRRRSSRESRRLKSVVNVMNSTPGSNTSGSGANWNLLNILSSAILNPKSAYNSDSGSIPGEERTNSVPPEIIERAEMCFNVDMPAGARADGEDASDSEDDLPLNLTIKKSHSRS